MTHTSLNRVEYHVKRDYINLTQLLTRLRSFNIECRVVKPEKEAKTEQFGASELRIVEKVLHDAGGALYEEKEDLADLKEQVQEHREDVEEAIVMVSGRGESARESKAARRLQRRVNRIISTVGDVLGHLDVERTSLREELIPPEDLEATQQRKQKLVAVNDLVENLQHLQKIPDATKMQKVVQVLTALDDNKDGNIDLELALEVIELIGKENVKLSSEQVSKISELLRKEDKIDILIEELELQNRANSPVETSDSESSFTDSESDTEEISKSQGGEKKEEIEIKLDGNLPPVPPPTALGIVYKSRHQL